MNSLQPLKYTTESDVLRHCGPAVVAEIQRTVLDLVGLIASNRHTPVIWIIDHLSSAPTRLSFSRGERGSVPDNFRAVIREELAA
jgi:hypothetical protein